MRERVSGMRSDEVRVSRMAIHTIVSQRSRKMHTCVYQYLEEGTDTATPVTRDRNAVRRAQKGEGVGV